MRYRRTFEYDAVSTSVEKVDSGSSWTRWKGLSSMRSYDAVLKSGCEPICSTDRCNCLASSGSWPFAGIEGACGVLPGVAAGAALLRTIPKTDCA